MEALKQYTPQTANMNQENRDGLIEQDAWGCSLGVDYERTTGRKRGRREQELRLREGHACSTLLSCSLPSCFLFHFSVPALLSSTLSAVMRRQQEHLRWTLTLPPRIARGVSLVNSSSSSCRWGFLVSGLMPSGSGHVFFLRSSSGGATMKRRVEI